MDFNDKVKKQKTETTQNSQREQPTVGNQQEQESIPPYNLVLRIHSPQTIQDKAKKQLEEGDKDMNSYFFALQARATAKKTTQNKQ